MSATTAPVVPPELAELRARFVDLSREWNRQNDALALLADDLRECGARISTLERAEHGGDLPGYAEAHGAR